MSHDPSRGGSRPDASSQTALTAPTGTALRAPTGDELTRVFRPEAAANRWELAAQQTAIALKNDLVIAFLGSASTGKDAAIRALFGVDFGQVDPVPGSTDRVRAIQLDADGHVIVVNAPGFGDLRPEVEKAARDLTRHMDIAVYLVNADGGATAAERRNIDQLRALGRPFLVCLNKIDLIRPSHQEAFIATTAAQLGIDKSELVVTAFDPLPALYPEPIGTGVVIRWLIDKLRADGKDLLFAKQLRDRAAACESIIQAAARRGALAGAVPVVGVDMAAVTAVQVKLISDIATVYGRRVDKDIALFIIGEALAGAGKGFSRWAVQALKTAGWIPGGQVAELLASALGATVSGAATYGVGKAAIAFMESNASISSADLHAVFEVTAGQWRDEHGERDAVAAVDSAAPSDFIDAEIVLDPSP